VSHSFNRFIQNADSSGNETSKVVMSESLNHSFNRFDSSSNETCLYEWVI